jgi:DNA polymerase elongation subunit (family B)
VEKAKSFQLIEWMWKRMSGRQDRRESGCFALKGRFKEASNPSSECILQWNYYGRLGETAETGCFSNPTNAEEDTDDFRRDSVFIKISPEDVFKSSFLKLPGCVPIDVRACFKRLYPRSEVEKESSLKFYLKLCGLDSKADMPFNRLWKFYSDAIKQSSFVCEGHEVEQESARNLREIANYCVIDALRCQELVVKRNVINDYREVASIAYVSLFDTHYRANGMKVRNLLGAYATKHDILFSTISYKDKEKGKYPGAYVFPPKKGIENARPVTGLDFASLYPSLIMAYNFSPEKIILNQEEADIVGKSGRLHKIEFPFNGRTLRAWSVQHDNCPEKKGLYPTVLEDLSIKRVALKAKMALLGKEKERLEKLISSIEGKGKNVSESLKSKYASLCFDYNCSNSKQFALKVYVYEYLLWRSWK